MTTNRIEKYLSSEAVQTALASPPSVRDPEKVIDGPKTYHALLQEEIERARQEGRQEIWDRLAAEITSRMERYVAEIVKLGSVIAAISTKALPDLKIVQYRAKIAFDGNWLKVFFIINAAEQDHVQFASLLNSAEQLLAKDGFLCNVLYVNERDREIDQLSIKSDFPFLLQNPSVIQSK